MFFGSVAFAIVGQYCEASLALAHYWRDGESDVVNLGSDQGFGTQEELDAMADGISGLTPHEDATHCAGNMGSCGGDARLVHAISRRVPQCATLVEYACAWEQRMAKAALQAQACADTAGSTT